MGDMRARLAEYTRYAEEAAPEGALVELPGPELLELLVTVNQILSSSSLVFRHGKVRGLQEAAQHTDGLVQVARRQELVAKGRDERVAAKAVQDGLIAVTATILARAQMVAQGEDEPKPADAPTEVG